MRKLLIIQTLVIMLGYGLAGCNEKENIVAYPTLEAYLQTQPTLSMFTQALEKANLQSFKNGPGPFTWFAPTNDAFIAAGITADSMNKMTAGALNYILLYHLINGDVTRKDMIAQNSFARATQMGSSVYLGRSGDTAFVNGNSILSADNKVSNGNLHILSRLNTPPNLKGNLQGVLNATGQNSLFIAALTKANRWTTLGSTSVYTVIAPTDAAMNAAGFTSAAITAAPTARIDSLVRYHLFSGFRLFTNDLGNNRTPPTFLGNTLTLQASGNGYNLRGKNNPAAIRITEANKLGTNGVVHLVDGVLRY